MSSARASQNSISRLELRSPHPSGVDGSRWISWPVTRVAARSLRDCVLAATRDRLRRGEGAAGVMEGLSAARRRCSGGEGDGR